MSEESFIQNDVENEQLNKKEIKYEWEWKKKWKWKWEWEWKWQWEWKWKLKKKIVKDSNIKELIEEPKEPKVLTSWIKISLKKF